MGICSFTIELFVAEILLTCEYLHSIQRTFQNMGPEMIYLDEEGHCCVSDFYLCLLEEDMPENASPAEYATPEKLIEATEIHASDYWRLGILMYECLVGFPPFKSKTHDREEIKEKITSFTCDKLKFPPWVTNESKDLMCKVIKSLLLLLLFNDYYYYLTIIILIFFNYHFNF